MAHQVGRFREAKEGRNKGSSHVHNGRHLLACTVRYARKGGGYNCCWQGA